MFRTLSSKFLSLSLLALLPLVGHAGFKEPPGSATKEHLIGPATVGRLTLTQSGSDAVLSFSGHCKGKPLIVEGVFLNVIVADLTADDLEDQRPGDTTLAEECYPIIADLIVNTVTAFANDGTVVVADVVVMAVVPAE